MIRPALRICPICSWNLVEYLQNQQFVLPTGHPLKNGYDVVACTNCGFVYADTSVSQSAYNEYYERFSKYEDNTTGTGGVANEWDRERQAITAQQIANFLDNIELSIIDVGCANGGLLYELKKLGYKSLLGIDPSPVCIQKTRMLNINAKVGTLYQPIQNNNIDCVILSHTLEHVQDLPQAAAWIKNVLTRSGYLYLEVPDAARYVNFVDAPFQDFNTEHINHFSMQCLHNYLFIHGFEPLLWGEKVIPASANKDYPAIYCFGRKVDKVAQIKADDQLKLKIQSYIDISRSILDAMEQRIRETLNRSRRIIVWGTGQLLMKLLVETSLAKAEIVAFVDSNPTNQGKVLFGVDVIPPNEIRRFTEPILISTTLHQMSIAQQIEQMGLRKPIIFLK